MNADNYYQLNATFSCLPPELRQYIWELTLEPQTLSITIHNLYVRKIITSPLLGPCACAIIKAKRGLEPQYKPVKSPYFGEDPEVFTPPPPGPLALHVCRESRDVALKRYELAFGGKNFYCGADLSFTEIFDGKKLGQKRIWIDFENDTILLVRGNERLNSFTSIAGEDIRKIRTLAIAVPWSRKKIFSVGALPNLQAVLRMELWKFSSLKTLRVLTRGGIDSKKVRADLVEDFAMQETLEPDWTVGVPKVEVFRALEERDVGGVPTLCVREVPTRY